MLSLPVMPDSAVVARDGNDVFMSFHFSVESIDDANRLSADLTYWLHAFLIGQGAVAVESDTDEYDG